MQKLQLKRLVCGRPAFRSLTGDDNGVAPSSTNPTACDCETTTPNPCQRDHRVGLARIAWIAEISACVAGSRWNALDAKGLHGFRRFWMDLRGGGDEWSSPNPSLCCLHKSSHQINSPTPSSPLLCVTNSRTTHRNLHGDSIAYSHWPFLAGGSRDVSFDGMASMWASLVSVRKTRRIGW
jgi:hypothetical protein